MAGRHSFAELRAAMPQESRVRAEKKAEELRLEMDLAELRRARQLSQEELAQVLKIGQSSVAKMEKRTDMYVNTLRRFIEAMGGRLVIEAIFPDHNVEIKQFEDLSQTRIF